MSKLIIFGDSISAGAWDEQGGWAARLKSELNQRTINQSDFYCMCYNLGISGDCLPDVTARMHREIEVRHDPADNLVLILAIGVNDSQFLVNENKQKYSTESFASELEKVNKLVEKYSATLLVLGPAPVDQAIVDPIPWARDNAYRNELVQQFNDIVKHWSSTKGFSFVDVFEHWTSRSQDYKSWLCDGVHPNTEGHRRIFELVLAEFETHNIFDKFIENAV